MAHQVARLGALAQQVGTDVAARDEQAVEVGRARLAHFKVDRHQFGRLLHVHAADPARMQADDDDVRARFPERRDRRGQFGFFETIGCQHRNALTSKLFGCAHRVLHLPRSLQSCPDTL